MIGKHSDSAESIDICEELQLAVSGGIDPYIFIYDLKTLSIRHKLTPASFGGYSKLMFSTLKLRTNTENEYTLLLYAASTVGEFYLIDGRSGEVVDTYKGHSSSINWFVEVKSKQWVITAGDDNICCVLQLKS